MIYKCLYTFGPYEGDYEMMFSITDHDIKASREFVYNEMLKLVEADYFGELLMSLYDINYAETYDFSLNDYAEKIQKLYTMKHEFIETGRCNTRFRFAGISLRPIEVIYEVYS